MSISTWKARPASRRDEFARPVRTYGSGFIIDPSGVIVTNRHVIDGAIQLRVLFNDGSQASAKLLAASPLIDLALLKVNVHHALSTLEWADSGACKSANRCSWEGGMDLDDAIGRRFWRESARLT